MKPQLIAELSDLFLVESLAADKSGDEDEADRTRRGGALPSGCGFAGKVKTSDHFARASSAETAAA